ncbi:glycosyltransferase [Sphingomonas glaciei]|uniref:Glycosyltransferase n=1 Tax=Sphingomonas glaciei TaxID=2938948 RepID=A0ABY5MY65_9SPHN|nr:glycosyltransferase [Sphingomonas glaciei]UUR08419.1 glycosyltransferase [Sphingomonas glaciei]
MPPQRKVAFFLPDLGGGGAERVQVAIIRHLVAAGHQVDLILAFHGGVLLPLLPPGVRIIELRAKRLAGAFPGLVRYLRAERPWSLQAIMWPCTVLAVASKMAARTSTKLLLSEHIALSKQYPSSLQQFILRATLSLFYPRAQSVVAVSQGAASDVEALAGMPTGAVEVIYNPMDLPPLPPPSQATDRDPGSGDPLLITVGRLFDQKNHALLLRAFRRVLVRLPRATLIILGEGALRGQLESLCKALGLEGQVKLPGFAADPWPLLLAADLFVLSSDYEGMSLVLVEAMHAGLRIVSTDCVAGPAELLENGRYGRLVPVGDEVALAEAILRELDMPRNRDRQRARARAITGRPNLRRYEELLVG